MNQYASYFYLLNVRGQPILHLINQLVILSIKWKKKFPLKFPRAQGKMFKLVLFYYQFKIHTQTKYDLLTLKKLES